jgi:putative membrane protein
MKKNLNIPIIIVSIAVPALVAILLYLPNRPSLDLGFSLRLLPLFHAIINGTTALLLLLSLYFIKQKQIKAHKRANLIAVVLSVIFLLSYVTYHTLAPSTKFGDTDHNGIISDIEKASAGSIRMVYYFFLLTHIVLSAVIIPFVLFTLSRAYRQQFDRHKKLARITWPMWLYVTITGVIVYIMISPYYA